MPSISRFATTTCSALLILAVTTPILAFNEPAKVTSSYEVLEPESWIGGKLPILEYIDIGKQLEKGNWLVLLYHHDCPDCAAAIPKYEQIALRLKDNEDALQIALIEVPPYGEDEFPLRSALALGKLKNAKEWFITTPTVVVLKDGNTQMAWEGNAPSWKVINENINIIPAKNNRKEVVLLCSR